VPELFADVLLDSIIDTLKLVPFLLVTYVAMEALEHGTEGRTEEVVSGAGHMGPLVGAVLGAVPQCGFSAMAATLFSGRIITAGTLVAVILSTSDEMLPVFLAHGIEPGRMVRIILTKVLIGIAVGFSLDAILAQAKRTGDGKAHIHELCERAHCGCDDDHDHAHDHGHSHDHDSLAKSVLRSALVHTVQVTAFIFVITLACGLVIEGVGQDRVAALVTRHPVRAVVVAALVGLIPNCGASVAISELFLAGTLSSGAMLAGLLASGGVGLLVLFRTNTDMRQNLMMTIFVYLVGVACGLAVSYLGVSF